MKVSTSRQLYDFLTELRRSLEPAFGADTAKNFGPKATVPSAGHCAAVAAIVHAYLGGELMSTMVGSRSHWFNRVPVGKERFDIDLTGDQFNRPAVQVMRSPGLYPAARKRTDAELDRETVLRAQRLASRAGLADYGNTAGVAAPDQIRSAVRNSHKRAYDRPAR